MFSGFELGLGIVHCFADTDFLSISVFICLSVCLSVSLNDHSEGDWNMFVIFQAGSYCFLCSQHRARQGDSGNAP